MATTADQLYGIRYGLNVDNLAETTDEEIDSFLNHARPAEADDAVLYVAA
jgi:hypothetical protein